VTIEEERRIFDELIRQARTPPPSQRYSIDMDEEYMEERDWLKKAFMSTYLDGTEQIDDRHPRIRAHYMGHWPKPELQAGDSSALDAFLGGFAGVKK